MKAAYPERGLDELIPGENDPEAKRPDRGWDYFFADEELLYIIEMQPTMSQGSQHTWKMGFATGGLPMPGAAFLIIPRNFHKIFIHFVIVGSLLPTLEIWPVLCGITSELFNINGHLCMTFNAPLQLSVLCERNGTCSEV